MFKQLTEDRAVELVAVNDLASAAELAYLLKHDSVYGRYGRDVRAENGRLVVDGQSCVALNEENLDKLPWGELGVDIVLECTGVFTGKADLQRHVRAGAKHVLLSAPIEEFRRVWSTAGRWRCRPRSRSWRRCHSWPWPARSGFCSRLP